MRASGYLVLFLLLPGLASPAEIYRCRGASGEPEFRQRPCDEAAAVLRLPREASSAAGLRESERAWLAARENRARRGVEKKPRRSAGSPSRDAQAAARRDYQCRRRQRQLEEVRADLRRGYAPARGERLRRRQRAHEDYLSAFCP